MGSIYFQWKMSRSILFLVPDLICSAVKEVFMPAFNDEFVQPTSEEGSVFAPWVVRELPISFVSVMNALRAMITVLTLKA